MFGKGPTITKIGQRIVASVMGEASFRLQLLGHVDRSDDGSRSTFESEVPGINGDVDLGPVGFEMTPDTPGLEKRRFPTPEHIPAVFLFLLGVSDVESRHR